MASPFPLLTLILLSLVSAPSAFYDMSGALTGPDMECGPRLLSLVSCTPFVQGSIPSPGRMCCDNLIDIYDRQPNCLCDLINNPMFISFPVNQTLAMQLPFLCHLVVNIAACAGSDLMTPESPTSPVSEGGSTTETPATPISEGGSFPETPAPPISEGGSIPETPAPPISEGGDTNSSAAGSNEMTPEPPQSQLPEQADRNSSAAASVSPVAGVPQVPRVIFGLGRSAGTNLEEDTLVAAVATSILTGIINWL